MKKLLGVAFLSIIFMTNAAGQYAFAGDRAEAILPIKARIVRCVTNEERQAMCQAESLCCNLPDNSAALPSEKDEGTAFKTGDNTYGYTLLAVSNYKDHTPKVIR